MPGVFHFEALQTPQGYMLHRGNCMNRLKVHNHTVMLFRQASSDQQTMQF